MTAPLRFLSVCSGIEAASVAWAPLGWRPAAVAEIDPFACRVLAARHGASRPLFMPDPASVLERPASGGAAEAVAIFKAARERRRRAAAIKAVADISERNSLPNFGDMERFKEWPDVSVDLLVGGTPCQAFSIAGFREGLADPRGNLALVYLGIVDRYRPEWVLWENVPGVLSSGGGRDFGAFLGGLAKLGYGFAYRVLDAQFVRTRLFPGAVPQRRRRVFVVAHRGGWAGPAAVLFDTAWLRGDSPPQREPGKIAPTIPSGMFAGGGRGTDFDQDGGLITSHAVAQTLLAKGNASLRADQESYVGIANSGDVGYCLTASGQHSLDAETETLLAVAHTLRGEGFDATEDGSGRGTPLLPVHLHIPDVAPTMLAGGNATGGDRPYGTDGDSLTSLLGFSAVDGANDYGETAPTLRAMGPDSSRANGGGQVAIAGPSRIFGAVRRLMPVECERLQGFPDGYTDIPKRNKNTTPDGPRYKAIGNSMAVNVMQLLGERIQAVREIMAEREGAR